MAVKRLWCFLYIGVGCDKVNSNNSSVSLKI